MSVHFDVAIVGAGIIGAACARECALNGMSVVVLERDAIASGATGAAMGHIVVMDDSPAQLSLTKYSQQLWAELAPHLPRDVEYNRCGTIWLARDGHELNIARQKHSAYTTAGIPARLLDPQSLAAAEPNLAPNLAGGLLVPNDAIISPANAAKFFLNQAMSVGASLRTGHAVTAIGRAHIHLDNGSVIAAQKIINASNISAPHLMPGLPIRGRKGHLALTAAYPNFARHQLVELGYFTSAHSTTDDSIAFNVQPRANGQLVIGSSRQYGSENSAVEPHIIAAIFARAQLYMPRLPSLTITREWTGFRGATPDKLPLIGAHPGDPTLYCAAGHEGLGITTSLATARLLVDDFLGRQSAIDPAPYSPARLNKEKQ
jgi:D-hydroxyproline dehydrogenase subunit beta